MNVISIPSMYVAGRGNVEVLRQTRNLQGSSLDILLTFTTVIPRGEKEFLFTGGLTETPTCREARGGLSFVVPICLAGVP